MANITDTLIGLDPWHGTQMPGGGKYGDLTGTRDRHMDLARYRRRLGQHDMARHALKVALSAHFRAMRLARLGAWRGFGMAYGTKAAGERL